MITRFAVLISGVLLNPMDAPMPKLRFAFMSGAGMLIWAMTDENGTFSVNLAPGTYRVRIGPELGEQVTVEESTSKVRLHRRAPAARVPATVPTPHEGQNDFPLPLGPPRA